MGKKSRVSWIVGGIVVAVALFAAVAFVVQYNSTDARIDRAVAQIVQDYGFEHIREPSRVNGYWGFSYGVLPGLLDERLYEGSSMTAGEVAEVVSRLKSSCPDCTFDRTVPPRIEINSLRPRTRPPSSSILIVGFVPVDFINPENEPVSTIYVARLRPPSLWERIKGLWPW